MSPYPDPSENAGVPTPEFPKEPWLTNVRTAPNGNKVTILGTLNKPSAQWPFIDAWIDKWVESGKYIYINVERSWAVGTGRLSSLSRRKPDLLGINYQGGKIDALEVLSPTDYDKIPSIYQRLVDGMNSVPAEYRGLAWIFDTKTLKLMEVIY